MTFKIDLTQLTPEPTSSDGIASVEIPMWDLDGDGEDDSLIVYGTLDKMDGKSSFRLMPNYVIEPNRVIVSSLHRTILHNKDIKKLCREDGACFSTEQEIDVLQLDVNLGSEVQMLGEVEVVNQAKITELGLKVFQAGDTLEIHLNGTAKSTDESHYFGLHEISSTMELDRK